MICNRSILTALVLSAIACNNEVPEDERSDTGSSIQISADAPSSTDTPPTSAGDLEGISAELAQLRETVEGLNEALAERDARLDALAAADDAQDASVAEQMVGLDERMAAADEQRSQIQSDLTTTTGDHEGRLVALADVDRAHDASITGLTTDLATIGSTSADDISAGFLVASINSLQSEVDQLDDELSREVSALNFLQSDVDQLDDDLSREVSDLNGQIIGIEGDLATLEGVRMDGLNLQLRDLDAQVNDLDATVADFPEQVSTLEGQMARVEDDMSRVDTLFDYMEVDSAKDEIVFIGANIHIQNGTGDTATANGRGNLIIGYNEPFSEDIDRSGSHNLVVGRWHGYSSWAGIVSGEENQILEQNTVAIGGTENVASGEGAVAIGGAENEASREGAVAIGGQQNKADATMSLIAGGSENWIRLVGSASESLGGSVIVGGEENTVQSRAAVQIGGSDNTVGHLSHRSAVVGGCDTNTNSPKFHFGDGLPSGESAFCD